MKYTMFLSSWDNKSTWSKPRVTKQVAKKNIKTLF